jgi:hypothetical protein
MRMILCAGAVALATIGLLSFAPASQAREFNSNSEYGQQSASIDIARIKSALRLTPSQERYWSPVEAALRELGHRQSQTENEGLVRRISHRVVSIALNSAAIHKLAVAARPLIGVLDEQQMQTAHGLAQEMGLGPVVAALR